MNNHTDNTDNTISSPTRTPMTQAEREALKHRFDSGHPPTYFECIALLRREGAEHIPARNLWKTGSEMNAFGGGDEYGLPAAEALYDWLRFNYKEDHWQEHQQKLLARIAASRRFEESGGQDTTTGCVSIPCSPSAAADEDDDSDDNDAEARDNE